MDSKICPLSTLALMLSLGVSGSATALTLQGTADLGIALQTDDGSVQKSELVLTPRWDLDLPHSARATLIARARMGALGGS